MTVRTNRNDEQDREVKPGNSSWFLTTNPPSLHHFYFWMAWMNSGNAMRSKRRMMTIIVAPCMRLCHRYVCVSVCRCVAHEFSQFHFDCSCKQYLGHDEWLFWCFVINGLRANRFMRRMEAKKEVRTSAFFEWKFQKKKRDEKTIKKIWQSDTIFMQQNSFHDCLSMSFRWLPRRGFSFVIRFATRVKHLFKLNYVRLWSEEAAE